MNKAKISVIMPALNEEPCLRASVANVLEGFERYGIAGELIIINDGSSDCTGAIAEELAGCHDAVIALHHEAPRGIGEAFRNGLRHAGGELVVYIPGDGEIDAAEVLRHIPLMTEVDLVVPYVLNPEIRSWPRRFLSGLYNRIMTLTFSVPLRYLNGTVIYRKAILEGITISNSGFFYQAELLIKTIRRNYLYVEVPYVQKRRLDGKSKSLSGKSLLTVFRGYCALIAELYFRRNEHVFVAPLSITARKQPENIPSLIDTAL